MAIRVMMIDEDVNHMEAVKQYFEVSSSIKIVKTINSLDKALEALDSDYDVLVLNMLLSDLGANKVLEKFKTLGAKKVLIATSEFLSSEMINVLTRYNPDYFVKKPYSIENLEKVILSIHGKVTVSNSDNDLKVRITDLLHSLGIPSHIKGYTYMRDGIAMVYKNENLIGSITKELYPSIANTYKTTSSRVERAIRHAIEVSWIRGDYNLMDDIFGNSIDYDRSKPTNSEFIITLADRLKLENRSE